MTSRNCGKILCAAPAFLLDFGFISTDSRGWLILGEQFTMPQYLCAALVLSSVAVSQHTITEPSVPPLIPAAQTPQE